MYVLQLSTTSCCCHLKASFANYFANIAGQQQTMYIYVLFLFVCLKWPWSNSLWLRILCNEDTRQAMTTAMAAALTGMHVYFRPLRFFIEFKTIFGKTYLQLFASVRQPLDWPILLSQSHQGRLRERCNRMRTEQRSVLDSASARPNFLTYLETKWCAHFIWRVLDVWSVKSAI